jgi:hypothetical protein
MALSQQNQAKQDFWGGLAGVAQGLHPGRVTPGMVKSITGSQQDAGSLFQNFMQIQQYQQQNQALQAFQRSAPDIAKTLQDQGINVTPQEIIAGGPQMLQDLMRNAAPTEAMKNISAWERQARASGMSEQDIASTKASMLGASIGGQTPIEKDRRDDIASWHRQNPGKTDAEMLQDKPELANNATYLGAKTEQGKTAALAGEEKASAITSYPTIAPVWENAVKNVDWLTDPAHKDAVTFAIQHPTLSGSWQGSIIGGYTVGQDALDARGYLDTLGNQQFRSGMQDVKNVRTQTEANKIGGSMTNLDRATNSQKVIDDELARLKDNAYRGLATVTAAAGKQVPYKYKGMADSTYLNKTLPSGAPNPYYNGATEEQQSDSGGGGGGAGGGGKQLSADDLAQAKTLMSQHGRDWVIKYLQGQGYKTDGL